MSINVIPDGTVTWLVISCPICFENCDCDTSAYNFFEDAISSTAALRKNFTLSALCNWTNAFASPKLYYDLSEGERFDLEREIAWSVCEKPYERCINLLEKTPAGADLVRQLRRELRNQPQDESP